MLSELYWDLTPSLLRNLIAITISLIFLLKPNQAKADFMTPFAIGVLSTILVVEIKECYKKKESGKETKELFCKLF